jgi:hypothetical protein
VAPGRTVRVSLVDCPRHLAGQSTRGWQLCSLIRFLPPSFVLPRVLQGIVPKTWSWSITLLSWRLVCDSIHHSCVIGICLGYRPGSLRRIFTGSYSLPPLSSRYLILQSHTHWVTLVRSVPMYLSCVIAQVPLVLQKLSASLQNQTHRSEVQLSERMWKRET